MSDLPEKTEHNTWLCFADCENQMMTGGSFDNPETGGCAIDDKMPPEIENFEMEGNYPPCGFYRKFDPEDWKDIKPLGPLLGENGEILCDEWSQAEKVHTCSDPESCPVRHACREIEQREQAKADYADRERQSRSRL